MKYENKIIMAFTDPDERLDDPYSTFTDNYIEDNVKIMFVFDTPEEFLETFNRIINDEEGPYGMWYWVLDHGKQICSGACDPNDIDVYEEHWNLNKEENDEMNNNDERVKQISLDVVVGPETDGEELANQIKEELETRGYTIFGVGFNADLTNEYHMNNEENEDDIECLIAQLQEKIDEEFDVYLEELRHMTTDEIIENSYKTSMLKEFVTCFENYSDELTDINFIKYLLQYNNLLENLYEDWKKYDSDEFKIYKEFVLYFWNAEIYNDDNIMTWEKLRAQYPEDREKMSIQREREYVNHCFDLYEKEGFSKTFWTPYEDEAQHIGKKFKVLQRTPEERNDLCTLPLWDIEFEDGLQLTAYPEEIIPSEIKANGGKI